MTNKNNLVQRMTLVGAGLIILSTTAIGYGQMKTNNLEKINRKITAELKELRVYSRDTKEQIGILYEELDSLKRGNKEILSENEALKEENKKLNNQIDESNKKEVSSKNTKAEAPNRGGSKRLIGTFEATAYDDSVESQGQWVGQTATGVKPQVGVIAVDPKVIPLGTKLYVEGYGNCTAADTGGAIKGNRIDVFKNTASEVRAWGRQQVKVYIRE